jgi:SAM-dependent methyltransferase
MDSRDSSSTFDAHAAAYEADLQRGVRLSGEAPEYFARRRVEWTARVLPTPSIRVVLDYGCGIGLATPWLRERFRTATLWGFDPSRAEIDRAVRERGDARTHFTADERELAVGEFDLAYANGVFHHIPPAERPAALSTVMRSLRPGGCFALWENNPWNPGTRLVMQRIPFDRDAVTLSPLAARRMLRSAGFDVVRTDAWFLFPHLLRWLRPLEHLVHRLPLGAQYLALAQRPER